MAYHSTIGINTARAWTWIATLLTDTRQVRGTLAVTNALRSTIRRTADELWQTGACICVVYNFAFTVNSTRRWDAGINR